MIHADGRQSLIEHVRDSRGRLAATLFRDGSGSARIFCFNAMERLVTKMIQRGVRTETRTYTYNELGNRVEIARLIIDDDWSFGSQPSVSFNSTEKS